ncbi:hypothetical protein DFJ58DRAFT_624156, partial [Suillus subalutaceus]|uniref:uncharacterized protein n=1 Tax=Suillus subalutaceus TaxID=48586 RepID=UPI001B8841C6
RMSYFPRRMILIVYSPHPVHEQTTSKMSFIISQALHSVQYNRTLLKTCVSSNSQIYSENIFTIPDMQVTMTPTTTIAAETQLLWMVESGFTQSRPAIMAKVGDVLLSHEELLLILMILVKEKKKFATPMADSDAWKETREEGSVRTYSAFAPARTADKLFGPVVALGHEWIDIKSVEYYVWVKSGDQRIDVTTDPTAHGTLFPDINMGDVTDALNRGMDRVKATMSHTLDTIESNVNHQHLLTPSTLTFNWELNKSFMSVAIYQIAHFHYCDWYRRQFSGTKHRRVDN